MRGKALFSFTAAFFMAFACFAAFSATAFALNHPQRNAWDQYRWPWLYGHSSSPYGELQTAHLPTARIGLSQFAGLLTRNFGVKPLRTDRETALAASSTSTRPHALS